MNSKYLKVLPFLDQTDEAVFQLWLQLDDNLRIPKEVLAAAAVKTVFFISFFFTH